MVINFECQKCQLEFDCEVGKIGMNTETFRPTFEKSIICPKCGERSIDEVLLTEVGQGQITIATMNL